MSNVTMFRQREIKLTGLVFLTRFFNDIIQSSTYAMTMHGLPIKARQKRKCPPCLFYLLNMNTISLTAACLPLPITIYLDFPLSKHAQVYSSDD